MRSVLISMLAIMFCITALSVIQADTSQKPIAVGETATGFSFVKLTQMDERISYSRHLTDKVVVLIWWDKGCKVCKAEIPLVTKLLTAYETNNVIGYIVNVDVDTAPAIKIYNKMFKKADHKLPCLYDMTGTKLKMSYNPSGARPYTLILGLNKKVLYSKSGFDTNNPDTEIALMKRTLDTYLASDEYTQAKALHIKKK